MLKYLGYINKIWSLVRPEVWILDGNEKSTNKPLKIIYIGTEQNKFHISKIAFDDIWNESYLGKKFFWHLYYLLHRNSYKCSIAIIDGIFLDRYIYKSRKDFYFPQWVDNIVNMPLEAKNKSAKNDLRKVRQNKLEYIVTKNTAFLNDFYYNLHKPMVQNKYKTGAFLISYNEMLEKMKEKCCELLLVKKEDIIISGTLLDRCKKVPRLWKNGIRYFKKNNEAALIATYVYGSQYLWEKGYEIISLGTTRSFLNDGLLQYKKKWNITIKSSEKNKRGYILKPLVTSDGVKGFFMNNPFIYKEKDKLYGAVFVNEDDHLSEKDYTQLQKQYYLKGLCGLNVFAIKENEIINKSTIILKKTINPSKKFYNV